MRFAILKRSPFSSLQDDWHSDEAVVVLSPHLDDAVLSVGGSIAALVEKGVMVTVLTVFAGCPPAPSDLARSVFDLWQIDSYEHRREEDALAMSILGCNYTHYDFPEALFRHNGAKTIEEVIACSCHCRECNAAVPKIVNELGRLLQGLNPRWLLVPEAGMFHVDHEITARAGRAAAQGLQLEVLNYEELPYACKMAPRRSGWPEFSEKHLNAKLQAVAAYRSQIPTLEYVFGGMERLLTQRASSLSTLRKLFAELVFA